MIGVALPVEPAAEVPAQAAPVGGGKGGSLNTRVLHHACLASCALGRIRGVGFRLWSPEFSQPFEELSGLYRFQVCRELVGRPRSRQSPTFGILACMQRLVTAHGFILRFKNRAAQAMNQNDPTNRIKPYKDRRFVNPRTKCWESQKGRRAGPDFEHLGTSPEPQMLVAI